LYNPVQPVHQHWRQQETDNNIMATMATAIFGTKQQPTVNIIISLTQLISKIVGDDVLSSLIVDLKLKWAIWLDMVQHGEPSDHGDGDSGLISSQFRPAKFLTMD
jgi:hypothetical protein